MITLFKHLRHSTLLCALLACAAFPIFVHAENIHYGSVQDIFGDTALVHYSSLTDEHTYECLFSTLACKKTEKTSLTSHLFPEQQHFINPQGTQAIVAALSKGGSMQYHVMEITNGKAKRKHTVPLTETIRRVFWSEKGPVVLTTTAGNVVQYDTAKNTISNSTPVQTGASWITASPNGRYLAYYIAATQSRGKRTYGIIDIQQQKTYTTDEPVNYWDLLTEGVRIFSFSPDSTRLLYLSDKNDYQTVYEVRLDQLSPQSPTFASTQLFSKPYVVSDVAWISKDTILFSANRDNPFAWSLYTYTITNQTLEKVADNIAYNTAFRTYGPNIIFPQIFGNVLQPRIYNTETKKISSFDVKQTIEPPKAISADEVVTVGGLSGVLKKPTTPAQPQTLLVWLHGGPYRQASAGMHSYKSYGGYDWMLNEALRAGVPVLKLDYPGSFGYSRSFAESVRGNVGTVDVQKTVTAINELKAKHGYTNVLLIGNSYGGYLALKTLVEAPQTINGAFSINGVSDWGFVTTKLQNSIFNVQFNGVRTAVNNALYEKASISGKISGLTSQKVVLAHGQADATIPANQSDFLHRLLLDAGKNSELVLFPNEDHVFKKPETFVQLCQKVLSFAGVAGVASTPSLCNI